MFVPLAEATPRTCGGKAGVLGILLRAGMLVPDGFVVPADQDGEPDDELGRALQALGDVPVAVRPSADDEDTAQSSGAGQYESALAVRGTEAVAEAIRGCRASLYSPRATQYRGSPPEGTSMAVLVQRLVDADASGVLFAPADAGDPSVIEASWGLGVSVVEGTVTPDRFHIDADGSISRVVADKRVRIDRDGTRLIARKVPVREQNRPSLDDDMVRRLTGLGLRIAVLLGGDQDIEWALVHGDLWILQARPVTAALPQARPTTPATRPDALTGTAGSAGVATGPARIVLGPDDFGRVRPGDILVCPHTDPAWTPLLRIVAGVVTQTGGLLSHAAIVAREQRIPAVLGVPGVLTALDDGSVVSVNGDDGAVTPAPPQKESEKP